MKILSSDNASKINRLNKTLRNSNFTKFIEAKPYETSDEVGVILAMPPFIGTKDHFTLSINVEYKKVSVSFSRCLEEINNSVNEILETFETELIKVDKNTRQTMANGMVIKYFLS